jgi:hypothetical protein
MAEKFWLTKYALSVGVVQEVEGERTLGSYVTVRPHGFYSLGRDVFTDRAAAIANADARRLRKIAALERHLAKLRKMTF